jgi:aminodeoxychorismate synthase component I
METHCQKPAFIRECRRIPWEDPFQLYRKIRRGGPSFLLESVEGRPAAHTGRVHRYSFLGANPYRVLRCKGTRLEIREEGAAPRVLSGDPLRYLASILPSRPTTPTDSLPPFIGGVVGYFGYDMVRFIEKVPLRAEDDLHLPDLVLLFVDTVIALDHQERMGWIIVSDRIPDPQSPSAPSPVRKKDAVQQILDVEDILSAPVTGGGIGRGTPGGHPLKIRPNMTRDQYLQMVRRCREFIAAGEIYQANLSQRLSAPLLGRDPLDLYTALREINPSPFAAFLDLEDVALVSSSPERLVRLQKDVVDTRPIAGTRPRGKDAPEEIHLRRELITNEKERAEHLMLVDLERNDLGRVCETGSICVDEWMTLESYSHVTHIVSNVRGRLRTGMTPMDLFRSVFPGGTITGVPKIRCMEIIDALEPTSRGPYTGSLGYISLSGDMDLNIIIRTLVVADDWAHAQVGAGIVADSDPEREYEETLFKAEALLKSLQV